jgi:arsenate reductase (thioredoxin)
MRILILCTGNSCRSQMAEGILQAIDHNLEVFSAGTNPSNEVHPIAIEVMNEIGVDISKNKPKHVDQFINQSFDFVITVCGEAEENCPVFLGKVKHKLHIGFEDPAAFDGAKEEVLDFFEKIRDQIHIEFKEFYRTNFV